jgi:hypothetical protein
MAKKKPKSRQLLYKESQKEKGLIILHIWAYPWHRDAILKYAERQREIGEGQADGSDIGL